MAYLSVTTRKRYAAAHFISNFSMQDKYFSCTIYLHWKIFSMRWYLAKIIFRIISGSGDHRAQFDEQFRLIASPNAELAFIKAVETGKANEDSFSNMQQETVLWKFINVSEIVALNEITDGAEVYSNIQETDNGARYEWDVHTKARMLQRQHERPECNNAIR
jgi:hypothetical protein